MEFMPKWVIVAMHFTFCRHLNLSIRHLEWQDPKEGCILGTKTLKYIHMLKIY